MTSFRPTEANRRNAIRSTGPRTEGKRQTRRNAVRHGLCAETVIEICRGSRGLQSVRSGRHRKLRRPDRRRARAGAAAGVAVVASASRHLDRSASDPSRDIARAARSNATPTGASRHRNCHRAGKEVDWWKAGAEPLGSARSLWTMTHPTGRTWIVQVDEGFEIERPEQKSPLRPCP
jgi:hypothetical protein